MEKISSIYFARMTAALHVQFHSAALTHLENQGAAALGLDAALTEAYKQAIAAEQDYVNRPLASEYTQRIAELDQTRDLLLDDILGRLRGARVSPDATARAAYDALRTQLLDRYPATIKTENYQRETGLIQGLLMDLEKVDEAVLKTLGVDALATELQRVNESFTQAYLARNAERVETGKDVLAGLRAAVDDLYAQVAAQLTYTANRPDAALAALEGTEKEKAAAQRTLSRRAVEELNEHIAYFKTHYLGGKNAPAAYDDEEDYAGTDGADAPGGNANGSNTGTGTGETDGNGGGKPGGPTDVTEVTD